MPLPPPHAFASPQPAAAAEARGSVEAFLRGIQPPLGCVDAAVAAVPASGVTMAHLVRASPRGGGFGAAAVASSGVASGMGVFSPAAAAASRFSAPSWKVGMLMDGLGIGSTADKLAFVDALEALGAQAGEAHRAGPPATTTAAVASPPHAPMLGIEAPPQAEEEGAAAAGPAEQQ